MIATRIVFTISAAVSCLAAQTNPSGILAFPSGTQWIVYFCIGPEQPHVPAFPDDLNALIQKSELGVMSLDSSLFDQYTGGIPSRWALVSPEGTIALHGDSLRSQDMIALVRAEASPVIQRARFLAKYPERMDVWAVEIMDAIWAYDSSVRTFAKKNPKTPSQASADAFQRMPDCPESQRLKRAYEAILKIPDWTRVDWSGVGILAYSKTNRVLPPLDLESAARRFRDSVGEGIRQQPTAMALWSLWGHAAKAEPSADPITLLDNLAPVPGTPWPPEGMFHAALNLLRARQDWRGIIRATDLCWDRMTGPGHGDRWHEARKGFASCGEPKLEALLQLREFGAAEAWLRELRRLAGQGWEKPGILTVNGLESIPSGILDLASAPALPDPEAPPMPSAQPTGKLILLGNPAWLPSLLAARHDTACAVWDARELVFSKASPGEASRLRAKYGWDEQRPRWVVLLGDEVLAQGLTAPDSHQLASQLEGKLPGKIADLRTFIRRHPEHLEARAQLVDLLRSRMPNPGLEPLLMQVSAEGCLPFYPNEQWRPLAGRYGEYAKRVTREAEELVSRMPGNTKQWEALWQWGCLLPKPPAIGDIARSIAPPPGKHLATGMRNQTMLALMPQLMFSKAFDGMDRLVRPRLDYLKRLRVDQDRNQHINDFRKDILPLYRQSLIQRGRIQDAKDIDQLLDDLLSKMDSSPQG